MKLEQYGLQVERRHDLAGTQDSNALATALDGAWGVIAGTEKYDESIFKRVPSLRIIARPGVGFDGIDLKAATAAGVVVFTTPTANANSVADFTVGLMLAVLRRISLLDHEIRDGKWSADILTTDLHHATIGIIGLGAIGRAVAVRLRAFECAILSSEPEPDREFCRRYGVDVVPLVRLLKESHVVSVHVPLLPETRHLIGQAELSLLRSDAVLINTSRGGVIDENALVKALSEKRIGGAGLDVFESEPLPASSTLREFRNVVLTSHAAARTAGAIRQMLEGVVSGLLAAARGETPAHALNPEASSAWRH